VEDGQGEDAADFIATVRADDCRASDALLFSFASGFSVSLPSSTATRKTDDSSLRYFRRGQG
jgi:hypothetical protein